MSVNRKKIQTRSDVRDKLYALDIRMINQRIDKEFIRENNAIAARWAQEKRDKIAKGVADEIKEQEVINARL